MSDSQSSSATAVGWHCPECGMWIYRGAWHSHVGPPGSSVIRLEPTPDSLIAPCPDCARLEKRVSHLEAILSALRMALGDE